MKPATGRTLLLALTFALAGCSTMTVMPQQGAAAGCLTGDAMQQTTLYFGLNRPSGQPIGLAEWQSFLDSEVTPRFKQGLTVSDAYGQWLSDNGTLTKENSKALLLIHKADSASRQSIQALRASYKQRFEQESVMQVDAPVCVAF